MLRNTRDVLYRFRILIICLGTTAIVGTSGALGITGKITDIEEAKNFYTYGDNIALQSEAVFKDSNIEYAVANSDVWSETAPKLVGDYKYRASSKSSFDTDIKSKEREFKIVPKKVDINVYESSVDYGKDFSVIPPDLLYEDKLVNSSVLVDNPLELRTTAYADIKSLKVEDKDGNDVTYCYEFNIVPKNVNYIKKTISIKQYGDSKIYDGSALRNEEYNVTGDLLKGDKIIVPPSLDITDIGTIVNKRDIKVVNKDNIDVTHFYNIFIDADDLEVTKRPFTIGSETFNKIYDDKPFDLKPIVEGTLLEEHELVVDFKYKDFKDVGSVTNEFSYDIVDKKTKESVLDFYDVTVLPYGSLNIAQRNLNITFSSDTKVYDGTGLSNVKYVANEEVLLPNHKIVLGKEPVLTNFGYVTNTMKVSVVDSTTNEDVSYIYHISSTPGKLEITKRPISVTINSVSKPYDGQPLKGNDITVTEDKLADGDFYTLSRYSSYTLAGTYSNTVAIQIFNKNGIEVTNNYKIDYSDGKETMKITKRPLKVASFSNSKVFDNSELTCKTTPQVIGNTSLVPGDDISISTHSSLVNVGKKDNIITINVRNSFGQDVSSCYDISYEYGTLEVTKKVINIESSYYKTYDGKTVDANFNINCYDLPNNCYLKTKVSCDGIDVGNYILNLDEIKVFSGSKDITDNFIINVPVLTLEISRLYISVTAESIDKIYDGTITKATKFINSNLAYGDTIECAVSGEVDLPTGESVPTNIDKVTIKNKDGKVVNYNYNITLYQGNIVVNKIPISFNSYDQSKQYNKEPLIPKSDIYYDKNKLLPGHKVEVTMLDKSELIEVADTRHNEFKVRILDEKDVDVTDIYYNVSYDYGILEITPATLFIDAKEITRIYSGILYEIKYLDWTQINKRGLVSLSSTLYDDNYTLMAKRINPKHYKNAGVYTYDLEAILLNEKNEIIQDSNNKYELSNYNIYFYNPLILKISKRTLTVTLASGNIYYGQSFENKLWISNGSLASGDHLGSYELQEFTEIGRNQINTISSISIINSVGDDVTSNYAIKINPGIVNILKPGETIDPPNPDVGPDTGEDTNKPVDPISPQN